MRRSRIVLIVSLLVALGIPIALLVHRSRRTADVDEYLTSRGFARQERCDRDGPLIEHASDVICYGGRLRGVTATLAFVTKLRPTYVPKGPQYVGDSYVALYLDLPSSTEAWPAPRIEHVGSATVLIWVGPWSKTDTRAHLQEIENFGAMPPKN
jgi:hypothetical protein